MTVDLPARSCEFTAQGCDVLADGILSDAQPRVVAPVGRRRDLSTRKLGGNHPALRLERFRHQNTHLHISH
jgi:hypothetical protein